MPFDASVRPTNAMRPASREAGNAGAGDTALGMQVTRGWRVTPRTHVLHRSETVTTHAARSRKKRITARPRGVHSS